MTAHLLRRLNNVARLVGISKTELGERSLQLNNIRQSGRTRVLRFIQDNNIETLNVAGPRASGWGDGYHFAADVVSRVIGRLAPEQSGQTRNSSL
jgi:Circularly permutated YpsA SLOG family